MSDRAADPVLDLELRLRYRHGLGALAPYFDALRAGRALASRCPRSGRVWFPPRPEADDAATRWVELSGLGRVEVVTRGSGRLPLQPAETPLCFALIAMDGADNLAFGRVHDPQGRVAPGTRVELTAGGDGSLHPAQAALYVEVGE